jgi:hypothetical protein
MKPVALIIITLIFISCKKKHKEEVISYIGQQLPKDSAELFAPGLVSTDSIEHSAPTFSPDGKTVLWSIMIMPSYKTTIYEMNLVDGKWSSPRQPSFTDTSANDVYPSFTPDGKLLYFSSSRNLPSGAAPTKGNHLWSVRRTDDGIWSEPVMIDTAISKGGDYAPSVTSKGVLYFTHGPFRSPDWNIVSADLSSDMNSARVIVPTINSDKYEDGPFVAPDGSYLIFESDRSGGLGGTDLYIAFKQGWSVPVNMGPKINSAAYERFARVSPDGKYLFFGSDKRKVNGKPNMDIYWIDASIIDLLR